MAGHLLPLTSLQINKVLPNSTYLSSPKTVATTPQSNANNGMIAEQKRLHLRCLNIHNHARADAPSFLLLHPLWNTQHHKDKVLRLDGM